MLDVTESAGDRLLQAGEVAVLLGVPKSWVYAETRAGRLPHVAIGRYRRYRRAALDAWIEAHESPRTAKAPSRFASGTPAPASGRPPITPERPA